MRKGYTPTRFDLDKMPKGAGETRPLDPDCCTERFCAQRDFNRSVMLTLDRLVQAYAGMHLLEWATAYVWTCDSDGHTLNCPDPGCTFGRTMMRNLGMAKGEMEAAIVALCKVLAIPAIDLTAQWHGFFDIEQARVGLEAISARVARGGLAPPEAMQEVENLLEVYREEVTAFDQDEYDRWFMPPEKSSDAQTEHP